MNWIRQNWIKVGLSVLISGVLIVFAIILIIAKFGVRNEITTDESNRDETLTQDGTDKKENEETFFSLKNTTKRLNNNRAALEIIKKGDLWLMSANFEDFDGDGEDELAMITSGANCGSCHPNELRIIKKDKVVFYKDTYDVDIWPAKGFSGFIIKHPIFKINEPLCCPSEGTVESYKVSKDSTGTETFIKISERKEPYINIETSTKLPDWNSYPAKEPGDSSYYDEEWSLKKKPIELIFDKLPKYVDQSDREQISYFVNKYGPNFADHYTVVTLGCGTQCQYFVVVDDITGIVYYAKLSSFWGAYFNADSKLLVKNPPEILNRECYSGISPEDKSPFCEGTVSEYYVWTGNHFDLVGGYKVLFEVKEMEWKQAKGVWFSPDEKPADTNLSYDQVRNVQFLSVLNQYIGRKVIWKGKISGYSPIDGIKFCIVDSEHVNPDRHNACDWFWAIPHGSIEEYPNYKDDWNGDWSEFMFKKYSNIDYDKINYDKDIFVITGVLEDIDYGVDYSKPVPNIEVIKIERE